MTKTGNGNQFLVAPEPDDIVPAFLVTIRVTATEIDGGWAGAGRDMVTLLDLLEQQSFDYDVDVVGV